MQQMFSCPNCGATVAWGEPSCRYCGMGLNWQAQQMPPPPSYGYQNQPPPYNQPAGQENPNQYWQQNMYGGPARMPKRRGSAGLIITLIVLLMFAAGGIGFAINGNFFGASSSSQPNDKTSTGTPPTLPAVKSFSMNPSAIAAGQASNLSWDVSGATSVSISPGIGIVSASGTQAVSPTATTTYTLTATNSAGSTTGSVTVTVNQANIPLISIFTATPSTVTSGQSSTLQWNITGATSVSINPGIGTVASSGTQAVSPTVTTTYTLTATSSAGPATASATVTVAQAAVPVITSFTASPSTMLAGQSSTLQWNVTGATSVSINQGIGTVASSGTRAVSPTATTTYTLTATNSIGPVTATATITMTATSVPAITSFTANPTSINAGASSTLQWTVTGADSVSIDQSIGTVATTGSRTVTPTATITYTLTATNSAGSASTTATVTVTALSAPVINSFTATPEHVAAGGTSNLAWSISGVVDSISIAPPPGVDPIPPYGVEVHPTVTTTYTLTATNSAGSVSRPVTVTVP